MTLKAKTRIQIDMGKMVILKEGKHLFSQRWGNLWEIPGNYKKIWLREVEVAIKRGTWIRDR